MSVCLEKSGNNSIVYRMPSGIIAYEDIQAGLTLIREER